MSNAVQRITELGILPVIHVKQAAWAEPLAQALIKGGLPAIEVLVRSEGALAWLAEQGVALREDYRKYDATGNLSCVYLKDDIAGFAVHIVK